MQKIVRSEDQTYLVVNRSRDPTETSTLRKSYQRALQSPLRELKGLIREGIVERGAFDYSINQDDMPVFRFDQDPTAVDHFDDWLRSALNQGYLTTVSIDGNEFVRSAYTRGVSHANSALRSADVEIPEDDIEVILRMPIHRDKLRDLYQRNFELLEGVTSDMQQGMRAALTEGLASGHGPERIARDLNDRVDKIGMHRSELIARTEIINAHSDATLQRYEQIGVDTVTVQAEFQTAGDERVCLVCGALEGTVMTLEDVRNGTFTFNDLEFPNKPPIHPLCRCRILPVTEIIGPEMVD